MTTNMTVVEARARWVKVSLVISLMGFFLNGFLAKIRLIAGWSGGRIRLFYNLC